MTESNKGRKEYKFFSLRDFFSLRGSYGGYLPTAEEVFERRKHVIKEAQALIKENLSQKKAKTD